MHVTCGAILRSVASYARPVPLAALTSKAECRVASRSRRKAPWAEISADAGGNTSWTGGAAVAAKCGGAGASAGAPSSNSTGRGQPGLDKLRPTARGGDDATLLAADENAARENITENPRNKAQQLTRERRRRSLDLPLLENGVRETRMAEQKRGRQTPDTAPVLPRHFVLRVGITAHIQWEYLNRLPRPAFLPFY